MADDPFLSLVQASSPVHCFAGLGAAACKDVVAAVAAAAAVQTTAGQGTSGWVLARCQCLQVVAAAVAGAGVPVQSGCCPFDH